MSGPDHRLGTLGKTRFQVIADAIELLLRDQRTHISFRLESGADIDLRSLFGDAVHNFVEDFIFNIEPGAGAAALAVVEEDGARRSSNGGVEIDIGENNVRGLSAQFKRYFLQIAGSRLQD